MGKRPVHGRVIGMRDVLSFHGTSVAELTQAFHDTVDEYLAWCAEQDVRPEKSWQGKLTFRPSEDLRTRLHVAAAITNQSVNDFMNAALERRCGRQ